MSNPNWHEDFGDEPSVEERIPFGWESVDTSVPDDEEFDGSAEPDFEQADEYFGYYGHDDEFGGEA